MRNPFKRPNPFGPQPDPLTREECQRIWRWERRMLGYYTFAMVAILGAISLASFMGNSTRGRLLIVGLLAVLAVAGAYVQFRERCPRCDTRLGRQSRLMLPQKCRQCGVEFPRQPSRAA